MPLGKMFGNPSMPQQNQGYPPMPVPGQFGGNNYAPAFGRGLQKFQSLMGGQGGLPAPPGLSRLMNGFGGNLNGGVPGVPGAPGGNPGWGPGPQNAGAQGYAAPGYPPQGFPQQQPMKPMQPMPSMPSMQPVPQAQSYPVQNYPAQGYPSQGFLSQGYPPQSYAPQGYSQGPGPLGQQPAWEAPKKGGIRGFISNLMGKIKK